MWVGIVGSRRLGSCGFRHGRSIPPSADELAHARVCPKVVEKVRMRAIVTRASRQPDFEGVVSGGAPGADSLAKEAADELRVRIVELPPEPGPEPFRERAFARNQKIVDKAGMLIAVFAPGPRSPGTSHTVSRALAKGIPVHVWHAGRWSTR
jgi:hypothetical protein